MPGFAAVRIYRAPGPPYARGMTPQERPASATAPSIPPCSATRPPGQARFPAGRRPMLALAGLLCAAWAAGAAARQPATLKPGTMEACVAACTACHGEQGRAGTDGYYPCLTGKPQEYLYHQLLNFRDKRRQYPAHAAPAGQPA